jgi:hypothetical protein
VEAAVSGASIQIAFEGSGDVAADAVGTVVGGDDRRDPAIGELGDRGTRLDVIVTGTGFSRNVKREQVARRGAAKRDRLAGAQALGEIKHGRDSNAAADENGKTAFGR